MALSLTTEIQTTDINADVLTHVQAAENESAKTVDCDQSSRAIDRLNNVEQFSAPGVYGMCKAGRELRVFRNGSSGVAVLAVQSVPADATAGECGLADAETPTFVARVIPGATPKFEVRTVSGSLAGFSATGDTATVRGFNVGTVAISTTGTLPLTALLCRVTVGAGLSLALPSIATAGNGKTYFVQIVDNGGGVLTLTRAGSDTINGATSVTLTGQWQTAWLVADATANVWTFQDATAIAAAAVSTHAALTTGVHGAGASTLATAADISTHSGLTTGTHGVGGSTVASAADISTHSGLATGIHGVGGSTVASAADISTHAGLNTGVHGAGGSTLATAADIATHSGLESGIHGATATPTASKIAIASPAGLLNGWIDGNKCGIVQVVSGLNVSVTAGRWNIGGVEGTYAGVGSFALTDDAVNSVYLDASGVLTKSVAGWPGTAHARLAVCTCAAGVTTVVDARAQIIGNGNTTYAMYAGSTSATLGSNTTISTVAPTYTTLLTVPLTLTRESVVNIQVAGHADNKVNVHTTFGKIMVDSTCLTDVRVAAGIDWNCNMGASATTTLAAGTYAITFQAAVDYNSSIFAGAAGGNNGLRMSVSYFGTT